MLPVQVQRFQEFFLLFVSLEQANQRGLLSNMCTLASALSLMASMKTRGRNLASTIRTLGPTSLSVIIFANSEAVSSRTDGFCELQNRLSRQISAPVQATIQAGEFQNCQHSLKLFCSRFCLTALEKNGREAWKDFIHDMVPPWQPRHQALFSSLGRGYHHGIVSELCMSPRMPTCDLQSGNES